MTMDDPVYHLLLNSIAATEMENIVTPVDKNDGRGQPLPLYRNTHREEFLRLKFVRLTCIWE